MSFLKAATEIGWRVRQTPAARCCSTVLIAATLSAALSGCVSGGWVETSYSGPPPEGVAERYYDAWGRKCTVVVTDEWGNAVCADNREEDRWGRDHHNHRRDHRDQYDHRDQHDDWWYKKNQEDNRYDDRRFEDSRRQDPPEKWKQDGPQENKQRDEVRREQTERSDWRHPDQNSRQERKQDGPQKNQQRDRVRLEGAERPDWRQLDQKPYPAPDGNGWRR
ncbi:MAG: hypothetical protein PHW63_04685 [Alphaproteobacteria bacterium]|nr:hypothetical protein [Alphaproteobacteria bacterium]